MTTLPNILAFQGNMGIESLPLEAGIYRIVNVITGESYIGMSSSIASRGGQHLKDLRQGKHHCRRLQEAFQEFGEGAFRMFVMQEFKGGHRVSREKLEAAERLAIATVGNCYNTLPGYRRAI